MLSTRFQSSKAEQKIIYDITPFEFESAIYLHFQRKEKNEMSRALKKVSD